jgi:hypothetical protein
MKSDRLYNEHLIENSIGEDKRKHIQNLVKGEMLDCDIYPSVETNNIEFLTEFYKYEIKYMVGSLTYEKPDDLNHKWECLMVKIHCFDGGEL